MNRDIVKSSLAIVVLSLLSACAVPPKEAGLAESKQPQLPRGKTFASQEAWWRQLNDMQLNHYIDAALYTSPSLRIIQARLSQIEASLGVLDAADKVQVGLGAGGNGVLLSRRPPADFAETGRSLLTAHALVQAKWSFDFWGKNKAQIQAALGRQNALYYEARQTEIVLANSVAAQYFAWQSLTAQKNILNQRIENSEQIERLLKNRIRAQIEMPSSVYSVQQSKQQLVLQKLELEKSIARAQHHLSVLIGRAPVMLGSEKAVPMAKVPDVQTNGLRADLLGKRPDISAQRALIASRFQNIRAAKADFYPNIELRLLAGLSRIDAFNLLSSNSGMLGIVPAVNLPIFTSGALKSKLKQSRSEYDEQVAIYDQTVLDAMRMAADALSDYHNSKMQYAASRELGELAQKSAASTLRRANAGLENKISYYKKKDEVLQHQAVIYAKQAEALAAWSNLHAQLGGGFKEK